MKYILFTIILMFSTTTLAHGSSHPRHCSYEKFEDDLITTCTQDGRRSQWTNKDWYKPEQVAKRKVEEKEAKDTSEIFVVSMALCIILFILLICWAISKDGEW